MKTLTLLVLTVATSFVCTEALAVKDQVNLTSDSLKVHGFAVATAKRDDGMIDVTLTRDLSKARSFDAASGLETDRAAVLEISSPAAGEGPIVRCSLDGEEVDGVVTYRFQLAPAHLKLAHLTVSENDNYKKRTGERREKLIGGGTHFTLALADVVKP
ncbi:MAG TPA: hypothetical protein VEA69_20580 [Tepidisphaeraceae bacterium]|nr:hypothetical protein [Tepidisphaeraceae bacterium]